MLFRSGGVREEEVGGEGEYGSLEEEDSVESGGGGQCGVWRRTVWSLEEDSVESGGGGQCGVWRRRTVWSLEEEDSREGDKGEGKAERFLHRGSMPTSTHQPKRLVCSPAGAGGGWELRLRLPSDPRERTGVGGVNTA